MKTAHLKPCKMRMESSTSWRHLDVDVDVGAVVGLWGFRGAIISNA